VKTIFLDANVLWSAAYKPGRTLWKLITSPKADWITSPYALAEAQSNLPPGNRPDLVKLTARVRLVPDAFGPPPVILRGKDIPILSSAALARADVLVTNDDRDFGPYFDRTIGGVKIILTQDLPDEI
jgi:predicted nucleic acid-binding protein